jgi:hypothetical protein
MNDLEKSLYRKKRTLLEACEEFGIPLQLADIPSIETCSSCSIWFKSTELVLDLDSNPICRVCNRFYGL